MSSTDRRITSRRRRPSPAFDRLEGRQMMSTVPTSTAALVAPAMTKAHHAVAHHPVNAVAHHPAQASATTAAHASTAHHPAQASATTAARLGDTTHHLVHPSATAHAQGKAPTKQQAAAPNLANFVIRYPYHKPSPKARRLATYSPIGGLTPAQVTGAYGVNLLPAANQGQGTTIAIIDVYNDPNILNDTNTFSGQYNLPTFNTSLGGPQLNVVEDTSLGPVFNAPVGTTAGETSLDVQWAHAIAPRANILLVEVADSSGLQGLLEGVQYAARQPGVVAVSLSYGGPDVYVQGAYTINLNSTYLANGPAATLPVTVSSGDAALPSFPATSDNVIAVGGTSLYLNGPGNFNYNYETSWGGAQTVTGPNGTTSVISKGSDGGGQSVTFGSPSFQSGNGVTYPNRSIPDLAAVADPYTGVAFYDSVDSQGGNPWSVVGGTSLAAPVVAGEIALAQQLRIAAGKPLLNSVQINDADYAAYTNPTLYASLFHDVTQGTNEDYTSGYPYYSSKTGYDLTTGLGTPKVNAFVPYLASI